MRIPELDRLFAEFEQDNRRRELEAAKADPKKHKLTKVFENRTNYRYYPGGKDGRGWEVRFCWSSHRNVAGYFLGWREVIPPRKARTTLQFKRDQYVARKVKRRAEELALRRARRLAEKNEDGQLLKRITTWEAWIEDKKAKARERVKGKPLPKPRPSNIIQLDAHR
jgi:hypothetical protein